MLYGSELSGNSRAADAAQSVKEIKMGCKTNSKNLSINLLVSILFSLNAGAVTLGQLDDFEDGTVQGWTEGGSSPNPPTNVSTGGPAGAGDNYLADTSSGTAGAGGKMVMFNQTQWTGDYIAAGIAEIHMQVRVFSGASAHIRIGFQSGASQRFVSTVSQTVVNDGAWHDVVLPISESDLTLVGGTSTYNAVLSSVNHFRIISSQTTKWRGDQVALSIGVDNIKAVAQASTLLRMVIALSDVNSNGSTDLAALREGSIMVEVRDGQAGALLRNITFLSDAFTPVTAAAVPDSDGNGVSELAVLATRNSDGRMVVELRNVTGPQALRQVWFAPNHTPVSMTVITGDADGNGIAELAVLSTRNSDGRGLVEVKNAFGATNPRALWAGVGLTPSDVNVIDDADGNGVPEVAILSRRDSDGRIVTEIKNAAGATLPNAVWFAPGHTAIDLTVVGDKDSNGVPEVAVLSSRDSDGRILVEVKNASGATLPSAVWFAPGHTALSVQPVNDADKNGVPEIAVLSTRDSDGRIAVEVKNVAGATNPNRIWYSPGFTARGLAILADADGNTVEEAAVLMIRDSDGRILVQSRNAAGDPALNNYWFSP